MKMIFANRYKRELRLFNLTMKKLTARQIEVLKLVAAGETNKRIASRLRISDQTVKNHLWSICNALEAADRTHAVVKAIRLGYIALEEGLDVGN